MTSLPVRISRFSQSFDRLTDVLLKLIVAQADVADRPELIPLATSLVTFGQLIGSSLGLA